MNINFYVPSLFGPDFNSDDLGYQPLGLLGRALHQWFHPLPLWAAEFQTRFSQPTERGCYVDLRAFFFFFFFFFPPTCVRCDSEWLVELPPPLPRIASRRPVAAMHREKRDHLAEFAILLLREPPGMSPFLVRSVP